MGPARWTIEDDIPFDQFGRGGGIQSGRQITFKEVETGREGIVWVPLNQYTVDNVAAAIQPHADAILAVAKLGQ